MIKNIANPSFSVSHFIGSSGVMVCLCPPVRALGSNRSVMILSELPVILVSRTLLVTMVLALLVTMMMGLLVLTMVMGHQLHIDQVRILLRVTGVILPGLTHRVLEPPS